MTAVQQLDWSSLAGHDQAVTRLQKTHDWKSAAMDVGSILSVHIETTATLQTTMAAAQCATSRQDGLDQAAQPALVTHAPSCVATANALTASPRTATTATT